MSLPAISHAYYAPDPVRSTAGSVCSVDPSATLFVQATCLNKSSSSSSPALFLLPQLLLFLVLFFLFGKVSPLSQRNRYVVRGNLINCLETSTLLLFWHKIPFYFHLPWPIFGLKRGRGRATSMDSIVDFFLPALLVFFIYFYVFII